MLRGLAAERNGVRRVGVGAVSETAERRVVDVDERTGRGRRCGRGLPSSQSGAASGARCARPYDTTSEATMNADGAASSVTASAPSASATTVPSTASHHAAHGGQISGLPSA